METKTLEKNIKKNLSELLSNYGFKEEGARNIFIKEVDGGCIMLSFYTLNFKPSYEILITMYRRFNQVENILNKYLPMLGEKNNEILTHTLEIDENALNGINSGTKLYSIINYDYESTIKVLYERIENILLPFIYRINSINELNTFINVPYEKYYEVAGYFVKDGGFMFRKMIVAKLVNKNYNEVCNFVLELLESNLKSSPELEKWINVYHKLKSELDNI
ncbi:MAG: hypothetical protein WCK82_13360 [Bacteroidota bacterium]